MIPFSTKREQISNPLLQLAISGEKKELGLLYATLKGIATEQSSQAEQAAFLFEFLLALHHADSDTRAAWITEALTYVYQFTFIGEFSMSRYIEALQQGRNIDSITDCILVEEVEGGDHIDLDVPVYEDRDNPTAVGFIDKTGHVALTINAVPSKSGTTIEIFADPKDPTLSVKFKDESRKQKRGGDSK